jgi:cysteine synthase
VKVVETVLGLIGQTPVIRLSALREEGEAKIFAKLAQVPGEA